MSSKLKAFMLASVLTLILSACAPDASEVSAKYTNEIALAIIDGSWKIASAIIVGLIVAAAISNSS